MGKVRRKSIKSNNNKSKNLCSQSKPINTNNKVKRKTRQKNIKNHIYMNNKPNAVLNSTSTIETIQINDDSIVIDKFGNIKTESSKEIIPNIMDSIIDISDTTIIDNKDENSHTVSSKETTTYLENDEIIDITDTTINSKTDENSQTISFKETAFCSENDVIIDITDTTFDSNVKSNSQSISLNSTISYYDDVQIIESVSQNNPIECFTISDDSDEECTQQCIEKEIKSKTIKEQLGIPTNTIKNKYNSPLHKKTKTLEENNTTSHILSSDFGAFIIDKQRISHSLQNNNQFKHRNVQISQKKKALKKTVIANKQLRPIIIDGLNIGHAHGCGTFSVKGIELCVQYFANRGHQKIIAFIPQHRQGPSGSESNTVLNDLYKKGHICYTPSRKVQNLRMTCYDDRIILDYAHQCGGVVVSNDNYRDLYEEKKSFKDIIENRQVMVTFVGDEIIVPDDQYNRKSDIRSLSDILCFSE